MAKVLAFVYPNFLKYEFPIAFASYRKLISKVVSGLYCFGPEIIRKSTFNEHYIFYCDNSFPSLFGKPIFFIYIWGYIFDCNPTLFAKGTNFDKDEFFFTIRP